MNLSTEKITGILTTAGKHYIARKALEDEGLTIHQMVLANVPHLSDADARDPDMPIPPDVQIVYRRYIDIKGFLDDNTVAWAVTLDQDVGDFDFNWIGLLTQDGTLIALDYLPLQRKRMGVNNVVTRSFVLRFAGAKALSRIDIPAQSWMFNHNPHLNALDLNAAVQARGYFENCLTLLKQLA